jgi:phospho-N-acetylmuramoyl-pentapeptide-transferase
METFDVMRIFMPAVITFLFGIAATPFLTFLLYTYKFWKPKGGKTAFDGAPAEIFNRLHEKKEVGTPRAGGILVWGSVLVTAGVLTLLNYLYPLTFGALDFISREQTWVPLSAFIMGSLIGFVDDYYEVRGRGGLRLRVRIIAVAAVALLCAWWFYAKLGVTAISFPFVSGPIELGVFFIPFFVLVALSIYAGGVIDGLDGLSGGVYASIFGAYAGIAFFQSQFNIAALCASVFGGLLAFLWFNIPPARFYLSETGTMGLTLLLTTVVFLTDLKGEGQGLMVLPIIALPLVVTVISNILQIGSKKIFHKKLFRIAPLHHHFEAIGWPAYKITMRYWIISIVCAIFGMVIALL